MDAPCLNYNTQRLHSALGPVPEAGDVFKFPLSLKLSTNFTALFLSINLHSPLPQTLGKETKFKLQRHLWFFFSFALHSSYKLRSYYSLYVNLSSQTLFICISSFLCLQSTPLLELFFQDYSIFHSDDFLTCCHTQLSLTQSSIRNHLRIIICSKCSQ